MSEEKFVFSAPPLSDYEREILTILIEECAEVQQRATKMLRFGRDEMQQGQALTNRDRLSLEVGDMDAMKHLCIAAGLIDMGKMIEGMRNKGLKLIKYLQNTAP